MADEFNVNAFDNTKIVNKIRLGTQAQETAGGGNTIIDMTHTGDTPETKESTSVTPLGGGGQVHSDPHYTESSYILSNEVTGDSTTNMAWSSNGKLYGGVSTFNADVSLDAGVSLVNDYDVITTKTWKVNTTTGSKRSSDVVTKTGTMADQRGLDGASTANLVIKPGEIGTSTWTTDKGYIVVSGEDTTTHRTLPEGAYGSDHETTPSYTKIKIDFGTTGGADDILSKLCKGSYLFGNEGTYTYDLEAFNKPSYLDSVTWTAGEEYAGWQREATVQATPIDYVEGEGTLAGSYTCYVGEYKPT